MLLMLLVNQLGTTTPTILKTLISSPPHHHFSASRNVCFTRQPHCRVTPGSRVLRCSNSSTDKNISQKISERKQWAILDAWNIPWDWKIFLYVMMPYFMSILLTGIVQSAGLEGFLRPHSEAAQPPPQSIDETAMRLFIDQLLKSVVKLSLLYIFVSPYQPFPEDIFSYRWTQPLNLHNGWLLWGVGGLSAAAGTVFLIEAFMSDPSAVQNKGESLNHLLPFIGASNISTVSMLSILGIIVPLCEETLYRGFLMTTLTKWFPVQVSVVLSSIVFSLAHQSPGKSIEIFIFGISLGLVYAQTRNLLAPIVMHATWNLGVILTLMYCQSQGYDLQGYLS